MMEEGRAKDRKTRGVEHSNLDGTVTGSTVAEIVGFLRRELPCPRRYPVGRRICLDESRPTLDKIEQATFGSLGPSK